MQKIVPAVAPDARHLAGVAGEMLRSLSGNGAWLAPAASTVAFVVDGLGAVQLRAHAAYARSLARAMPRKHVTRTVFPSTTAAALGSILTGQLPGRHGLVGYRALDPERGVVANQLNGYERDGLDPDTWLRSRTVFQAAADRGFRGFAVGAAEYASTGLTSGLMRGAEYVAEDDLDQRVRLACELAAQHAGSFVYCYIPDLDKVGHAHGVGSDEWRGTLEYVDQALRSALSPPAGVGVIVTADHGMVDVPRTRHVLLQDGEPRLDGVTHIGGEPRMLHLYTDDGVDAGDVARVWRSESEGIGDVSTRDEAIADRLFGEEVLPHVRGRIGDVLVAARGRWAFYDDRLHAKGPQSMIGQHGSTTPEETIVPLIRVGAYGG